MKSGITNIFKLKDRGPVLSGKGGACCGEHCSTNAMIYNMHYIS